MDDFASWFAGSKVVDQQGNPLVLYHGTKARFKVFREDRIASFGFHLGTLKQARFFSPKPMALHARITKPIRTEDLGTWAFEAVAREMREQGIINEVEYVSAWEVFDQSAKLREILLAKGYDGIVYQNEVEGRGDSYIAFKPDQIRLLTPTQMSL